MTGTHHTPDTYHRLRRVLVGAMLATGALALAACSSSSSSSTTTTAGGTATTAASSGGSGSGSLNQLTSALQSGESKTFLATYTSVSNGQTQTITLAKDPPKSYFGTGDGSAIINNGTTTLICSNGSDGSGDSSSPTSSAPVTCISESGVNPLASLSGLVDPKEVLTSLKGFAGEAEEHIAGITVTGSTQTIAGVPSTCANISVEAEHTTYCAGTDSGILTLAKTSSGSITLVSYTTSVPASQFQPPAGATTETIPGGL
jgi:hypothetical protein